MPQDVLLSRDLLPLKKGTLWSSTKSLLAKTWTGKWCTLQGATIVYSPDVRDSRTIATPLFTTPIRSITAINKSALHDNKELHALAITLSSGEVHTFYADSERDRNEWCVFFDQQVQRVCFADIYKLRDGPPLGEGNFATVYKVMDKQTHEVFAAKVVAGSTYREHRDLIAKEFTVWSCLGEHPHIGSLVRAFQCPAAMVFVVEYYSGGQLCNMLSNRPGYSEKDARQIARQALLGLAHLHRLGLNHMDLKPENVLFDTASYDSAVLKIVDFSLSCFVDTPMEPGGTPEFICPCLLNDPEHFAKVGCKTSADMWSIGVLIYYIIAASTPFDSDDLDLVLERVKKGTWSFKGPVWDNVSDTAKDLISKLLRIDPTKRPSCKAALNHAWFHASDHHLARNSLAPSVPLFRAQCDAPSAMRKSLLLTTEGNAGMAVMPERQGQGHGQGQGGHSPAQGHGQRPAASPAVSELQRERPGSAGASPTHHGGGRSSAGSPSPPPPSSAAPAALHMHGHGSAHGAYGGVLAHMDSNGLNGGLNGLVSGLSRQASGMSLPLASAASSGSPMDQAASAFQAMLMMGRLTPSASMTDFAAMQAQAQAGGRLTPSASMADFAASQAGRGSGYSLSPASLSRPASGMLEAPAQAASQQATAAPHAAASAQHVAQAAAQMIAAQQAAAAQAAAGGYGGMPGPAGGGGIGEQDISRQLQAKAVLHDMEAAALSGDLRQVQAALQRVQLLRQMQSTSTAGQAAKARRMSAQPSSNLGHSSSGGLSRHGSAAPLLAGLSALGSDASGGAAGSDGMAPGGLLPSPRGGLPDGGQMARRDSGGVGGMATTHGVPGGGGMRAASPPPAALQQQHLAALQQQLMARQAQVAAQAAGGSSGASTSTFHVPASAGQEPALDRLSAQFRRHTVGTLPTSMDEATAAMLRMSVQGRSKFS